MANITEEFQCHIYLVFISTPLAFKRKKISFHFLFLSPALLSLIPDPPMPELFATDAKRIHLLIFRQALATFLIIVET